MFPLLMNINELKRMASKEQQPKIFQVMHGTRKGGVSGGTNHSSKSFSLLNHREHI